MLTKLHPFAFMTVLDSRESQTLSLQKRALAKGIEEYQVYLLIVILNISIAKQLKIELLHAELNITFLFRFRVVETNDTVKILPMDTSR